MLRALYDWVMALAAHRHAERWLALISFAESSFFPIPPDVMLLPMVLARRERAFRIAAICTVASVLGGLFGYAIGALLLDTIGMAILKAYGLVQGYEAYVKAFEEWGLWIILIKGLTPIPYKVVTIASGAAKFDLMVFVVASVATRGARFFLVAALLWRFGPPIKAFIERYLTLLTTLFAVALIGGFVAIKYLI
ncbi:MAG: DedA family protein [Alphaproteobacteria bacterium]|nr:DedA family protein [Alphaproteobacteria bacterium]